MSEKKQYSWNELNELLVGIHELDRVKNKKVAYALMKNADRIEREMQVIEKALGGTLGYRQVELIAELSGKSLEELPQRNFQVNEIIQDENILQQYYERFQDIAADYDEPMAKVDIHPIDFEWLPEEIDYAQLRVIRFLLNY